MVKNKLKNILPYGALLVIWFGSLFVIAYLGLQIIPHTDVNSTFGYPQRWSNWDGNNYVSIASVGYEQTGKFSYAFFPFYPLLIHILSFVFIWPFISAWIISIACCIGIVVMLRKLLLLDYSEELVFKSVLLVFLFPTAFYFFATYTEALFFFCVLSSMYFFRNKRFLWSTLFAVMACATRINGLALTLFFAWEIWSSRKSFSLVKLLPFLGCFIGLGSYMLYLYYTKGDPFYFHTIQKTEFYRNALVLPISPLIQYLLFWYENSLYVFEIWFRGITFAEVIAGWVFLILMGFAAYFQVRFSYILFALASWSLPLSTGNTASMLRFVLLLFPCFIAWALLLEKHTVVKYIWYILSAIGLILATMYFHTGHWIG